MTKFLTFPWRAIPFLQNNLTLCFFSFLIVWIVAYAALKYCGVIQNYKMYIAMPHVSKLQSLVKMRDGKFDDSVAKIYSICHLSIIGRAVIMVVRYLMVITLYRVAISPAHYLVKNASNTDDALAGFTATFAGVEVFGKPNMSFDHFDWSTFLVCLWFILAIAGIIRTIITLIKNWKKHKFALHLLWFALLGLQIFYVSSLATHADSLPIAFYIVICISYSFSWIERLIAIWVRKTHVKIEADWNARCAEVVAEYQAGIPDTSGTVAECTFTDISTNASSDADDNNIDVPCDNDEKGDQ